MELENGGKNEKWSRRYMDLAKHIAQWSKDSSTKVGAVLVGRDRRRIAFGYNGFPLGIKDTPERYNDKETKYRLIQHAERNAMDNATFALDGATLAVTLFPCSECAKSIIQKGIRRVLTPPLPDREPWATQGRHSLAMFEEAGVVVEIIS